MGYQNKIKALNFPSFDAIRGIAVSEIDHLSKQQHDLLYEKLKRGTALIETNEQLCAYLRSFGKMHKAKLLDSIKRLPAELLKNPFEIVDWGCGQALGTINIFDHLLETGNISSISKVTLIEPSQVALERAKLHVEAYMHDASKITCICEFFEEIKPKRLSSNSGLPILHVFSNILDVVEIDLRNLSKLIDSNTHTDNYVLSVGPLNPTNKRIDAFFNFFDPRQIELIYRFETRQFGPKANWTYKSKIYKLSKTKLSHLLPIEFFPPVQFHAVYELDGIRENRLQQKIEFPGALQHFEVIAPFDLGASTYDDVHPILAVLHNIIVRGLPTKSSILIEEAFDKNKRIVSNGEINFRLEREFNIKDFFDEVMSNGNDSSGISKKVELEAPYILTPITISRFQKVLVEAIITDKLQLNKSKWKFLIKEEDVPFASLGIDDFKQLFSNLTALTETFKDYMLPEIELHIISNEQYLNSYLHSTENVYLELPAYLKDETFDLVVTQSSLRNISSALDDFSKYKAHNHCYFHIRNSRKVRSERVVYTSSLIKYSNLVQKSARGVFTEIDANRTHLTYFLQLLFRKEKFRPGQLPILDRALQNLPVIGLLPTGGGKSLTYQIAALLQPGVTMVIDPLKALMKDQYEGLVKSGIDYCAYINSSLTKVEKEQKENQLESSQLLFVFLSPERLSMANFRERLRNMHDYNVYFSYGVIDEVHCVSEWGHDFRFSYLHLGRNLYNYVKSKEGVISLFGLTATASFDVLADVERELSGNGAFELDADVIIRYENTNRVELQYKIERVPVDFEVDKYYDRKNQIPAHLPKALNISNKWKPFEYKRDFLTDYLNNVPSLLNELQTTSNLKLIKDSFIERQNTNGEITEDLRVPVSDNFLQSGNEYRDAGIVFCPHVSKTPLSVESNSAKIRTELGAQVGSFTGSDNNNSSFKYLDDFRENKLPLMVATKAFGMGIDKPNVRFTVNMNYSSSLEAFVQEAGRAGRDRKIAFASILVSDYHLAMINTSTNLPYSAKPLTNKWFHAKDLDRIISEMNLPISKDDILYATPKNDIVKLHCRVNNKMFRFKKCDKTCSEYKKCQLRRVSDESREWKPEFELQKELESQGLTLTRNDFQYLNADYQSVIHFFNESFKGEYVEKEYMNRLLNTQKVSLATNNNKQFETASGFLTTLNELDEKDHLTVLVGYNNEDYSDLSKAIYRMCCINLIVDFTQDYRKRHFKLVIIRKKAGGYYAGLKDFLLRYYTAERASKEIERVKSISVRDNNNEPIVKEIYQCLAYLADFVYHKISEKRKRAIDDMRNFCMEGMNSSNHWLEVNEKLKDFIYYYFNSKYAKSDYFADNGEPYSLVNDTEGGKKSSAQILEKYLRVIDDEVAGLGTPLDNVKHLYGAVRLISRSLTDSNPALTLLDAFCLLYLGFKSNHRLKSQFERNYSQGMKDMAERMEFDLAFWTMFTQYNQTLRPYFIRENISAIVEETKLSIHTIVLKRITLKYTESNV